MPQDATIKLDKPKKKKVLLVEDEVNIAAMVKDWLSDRYDMVVAHMGKDGVQKAISEQPDIILEDLNIPDMTGFDVIKLLKNNPKTKDIPIIILTGQKLDEKTTKFIAEEESIKGFVNKPFRVKDFIEKIEEVLSETSSFVLMEKKSANPKHVSGNIEKTMKLQEISEQEGKKEEAPISSSAVSEKTVEMTKEIKQPESPKSAVSKSPKKFSSRIKGFFTRIFRMLFLIFLGACLIVWGAEMTCRYTEYIAGEWLFLPPMGPSGVKEIPASMFPKSLWQQNDVVYKINSIGLRDEEISLGENSDLFRIFLLGGNSVFGQDIALKQTVSKRLERILTKKDIFSTSVPTQVAHGGLWGFSPDEQWAFLEKMSPSLKSDLVIWVVGNPKVTPLVPNRLRTMSEWPSLVHQLGEKSRFFRLIKLLYLYRGPENPRLIGIPLLNKIQHFVDNHSKRPVVILLLDKKLRLDGLNARDNLMIFNVGKNIGLDLSQKGLTRRGHKQLSKIIYSILKKRKNRIISLLKDESKGSSVPTQNSNQ